MEDSLYEEKDENKSLRQRLDETRLREEEDAELSARLQDAEDEVSDLHKRLADAEARAQVR